MKHKKFFFVPAVLVIGLSGAASAQNLLITEDTSNNEFGYAPNSTVMQVSSSGSLSPYLSFSGPTNIYGLATDPKGNLYTVGDSGEGAITTYKVTPSGTTTIFGTTNGDADDNNGYFYGVNLAMAPNGNIFNSSSDHHEAFENSVIIETTPSGTNSYLDEQFIEAGYFSNVVVTPNGSAFFGVVDSNTPPPNNGIYEISPSGTVSEFSSDSSYRLATDASGNLFGIDPSLGQDSIYEYASDGSQSLVATIPGISGQYSEPTAATFGPNGDLYVADMGNIYQITPGGMVTNYTPNGSVHGMFISGLAFSPAAVPEPSSFAIFGLGLVGAALGRRKRNSV